MTVFFLFLLLFCTLCFSILIFYLHFTLEAQSTLIIKNVTIYDCAGHYGINFTQISHSTFLCEAFVKADMDTNMIIWSLFWWMSVKLVITRISTPNYHSRPKDAADMVEPNICREVHRRNVWLCLSVFIHRQQSAVSFPALPDPAELSVRRLWVCGNLLSERYVHHIPHPSS